MKHSAEQILSVLDRCCDEYTFPMLDNGYLYLAAARLSLHRSDGDWAMVIEGFGFSPRAGLPDTDVQTFASRLHDRDPPENYATREAYENYLANHPNNEFRSVYPIEGGEWLDGEHLAADAKEVLVRGRALAIPPDDDYARFGIELEDPDCVRVFELCR